MKIREVNDLSFEEEVLRASRPVLVDFGAEWCGPCRRQEPVLEKLAEERTDLDVVYVDVEASPETARTYGVRGVPTLILFRDGQPAATRVGLQPPARLTEMLEG